MSGMSLKSIVIALLCIVVLITLPYTSHTALRFSNAALPLHKSNNYAYAAFLAAPSEITHDAPDEDDMYFVNTRMLIYQALYAPATRTVNSYPFVVLVTPDVTQSKRQRLEADGAQVIEAPKLALKHSTRKQWRDVLTKLRLFELTQFDKVLFLDSDMLLVKPMDGIFSDPAVEERANKNDTSLETMPADEAPQPQSYLFAAISGSGSWKHVLPPKGSRSINAGCVVFRPSLDLFNYYVSLAQPELEGRFNGRYPEQGLWAYAHRPEGNMPWGRLDPNWNINWATHRDLEYGIASLHSKFWQLDHDPLLRDYGLSVKWTMEGYWEGRERREIS
ncbi:glycosyltransferase family 8 protein [Dothidotthia symphoricarpi CBS 119687]|uniref:Glycosyltransferase family 8 protein n=1 Tax=Dothidotthia symphoricarpi CBS 119687 TaxID=1392245 RepID=A0A6A5ZWP1_9PLEO|nr:glycosyltransferase family 8 protein [Dothidotthia symphoricarpi CBS 119687]KAF2123949.1 glycosyltransferase family 8 protein [Dothidotthia symphoricarpi CBS 119687]